MPVKSQSLNVLIDDRLGHEMQEYLNNDEEKQEVTDFSDDRKARGKEIPRPEHESETGYEADLGAPRHARITQEVVAELAVAPHERQEAYRSCEPEGNTVEQSFSLFLCHALSCSAVSFRYCTSDGVREHGK